MTLRSASSLRKPYSRHSKMVLSHLTHRSQNKIERKGAGQRTEKLAPRNKNPTKQSTPMIRLQLLHPDTNKRSATDLRDALLRGKKSGPPEIKDNQDLRDRLQRKRSITDLRDILLLNRKSEPSEGNNNCDLRDHLQHARSTDDLRDFLSPNKKPKFSEADLRNKLTTKKSSATPNLRETLSDKRPSVFCRINVIHGGSPLCNGLVKSIKEYQRRAVTARRWPTKHEGETSITFSEGDLTDIDQPHNDPLLVELQIGTCEVTRERHRLHAKREPTPCTKHVDIRFQKPTVGIDPDHPDRTVGIGSELSIDLTTELTTFLRANKSTFAWTTADIPGIDSTITSHRFNVDPTYKPIKQKHRKLGPERAKAVNDEVDRILGAGSIAQVKYPDWLANPVVVKKKNGKWRVCIDFTALNKACPKDSFPLPHIDQMVESTAGNELLSFMDAFSGYNQIMMHPNDREKTSFITDRGTYYYRVMPFGLKNAGATSQRLVNKMFADKLGVTMEDETEPGKEHFWSYFGRISWLYWDKTRNRSKSEVNLCGFGLTRSPKRRRKFSVLPDELRHLTVSSLGPPISVSRSTDKCLPFSELLRGNKRFLWDEVCEQAFSALKHYLTTPPILAKPDAGDIMYLYIAISSSAVSSVLIKEDRGEQHPIFYTSKRLTDTEMRYPTLERMALAVVTSARKLRPYFQSHSIIVLTDLLLRTILQNANQSGRLSKWTIELSEYDISYKSRPAIKAQVLADFIIEIPPDQAADLDILVKNWILHVDGASSNKGSGIGVHLQSPTRELIEQSFQLGFAASNNEAEYETLIAGLRLAKVVGAKRVQAFCDSQLVASQYSGDYEAKNERMDAYIGIVRKLTSEFDHFELVKVPMKDNCFADALAALGRNQRDQVTWTIPIHTVKNPSISLPIGKDVLAISSSITEITESTTNDVDWRTPFLDYLDKGILPENKWESRRLKAKSSNYVSIDGPQTKYSLPASKGEKQNSL
ncbi:hypothetical protein N665_0523s0012 [Sinapis alba]|nr:hypothetical protein N665_0523s0012 [Sinapis alba]